MICQGTHFIIQSALSIAKCHLNQSFSIFIYVFWVVLTFVTFKLLKDLIPIFYIFVKLTCLERHCFKNNGYVFFC